MNQNNWYIFSNDFFQSWLASYSVIQNTNTLISKLPQLHESWYHLTNYSVFLSGDDITVKKAPLGNELLPPLCPPSPTSSIRSHTPAGLASPSPSHSSCHSRSPSPIDGEESSTTGCRGSAPDTCESGGKVKSLSNILLINGGLRA